MKFLISFALLLLVVQPALADRRGLLFSKKTSAAGGGGSILPEFVRGATNGANAGATTISVSIQTSSAGANRCLLVFNGGYNAGVSNITMVFNTSEIFTKLAWTNAFDTSGFTECWFLLNPSETTANVLATFSGSASSRTIAVELYTNVTSVTLGAIQFGSDSGQPGSTNTMSTTTTTDLVVDGLTTFIVGDHAAGAGQTERVSPYADDGETRIDTSQKAGTGSAVEMRWITAGDTRQSHFVLKLSP